MHNSFPQITPGTLLLPLAAAILTNSARSRHDSSVLPLQKSLPKPPNLRVPQDNSRSRRAEDGQQLNDNGRLCRACR